MSDRACPTGVRPCGEAGRADIHHGVWCACEVGVEGIDPRVTPASSWQVGDVVHGYAGGAFGRDSYACRRVEAVGPGWLVTRNDRGPEFVELARLGDEGRDRRDCDDDCTGP